MTDRLPPYSAEAEQGVLGCCLLNARQAMPEAQSAIGSEKAFYDLRHQVIWKTLCAMTETLDPIDVMTLRLALLEAGELERVGGMNYLSDLLDATPSAANLSYYLNLLLEKWQLRGMVKACTETVSRIYDLSEPVEQILDKAERDVLEVRKVVSKTGSVKSIKTVMPEVLDQIEAFHTRQGAVIGIPTGFVDLDRMTSGLHETEMTVVAAFPSVGKTSLAMNISEHVAIMQRIPVGVFSVEMSAKAIVMRLLCSRARSNLRTIREGYLSERDWPRLATEAHVLAAAPLYFVEQSDLTISQVRAIARRMHQESGIKLIVVDYLQLLHASGRENKTQETAAISSGLKQMAKELNVHVIACSQLTKDRDGTVRCRNAAEIHQDADNLFVLTSKAERDDQNQDAIQVELMIQKQRNGPTGPVQLTFLRSITRFESASKVSDDDVREMPLPYRD